MNVLLQQIANAAVLAAAYLAVTVGLFLIFNVLHIPNFAHGEMYALGAYFQYTLVVLLGLPFFPSVVLSMALVAVTGYLVERFVFRRLVGFGLLSVLMGSLALATVLQEVIRLTWGGTPISVPLPLPAVVELGNVRIGMYRLLVMGVVLVACALTGWIVYYSGFGRKLRALAQNRDLSEYAGVNVTGVGALTFMLGSALTGLAGALSSAAGSLEPHMGFYPTLVAFVILTIVGAGGRLPMVVAGGIAIAIIETLTAGYISNAMRTAVVFAMLVAFLVWRPDGAYRGAAVERARL
ncbi:MAG: branched-chain amino acid ABC transporter permease [Lautropia sp.]